jgi:CRP-like cAMP-binding protein
MPPSRLASMQAFAADADDPREEDACNSSKKAIHNELLRALPADELDRVLACAELVPLKPRQVLIEANLSVLHAYFFETGVASVLGSAGPRKPMEVCLVGRRGFVGIPIVLGTGRTPMRVMVQLKGRAWRIPAADFEMLVAECPVLRRVLYSHIQGRLIQEALLNVCNACHSVPERICRWLLMARDRMRSDHIPATHDLIARMLGVRRPGVTAALGDLEKRGVIKLARGNVEIGQPRALERCACRCAQRIDGEYDRLLKTAIGIPTEFEAFGG